MKWQARCPLATYQQKLLADGMLTLGEIQEMEQKIDAELAEAFACARQAPVPKGEDLHLYLFCES
jgi:TPP-dependent pyruvate/acetoin dehydrogenase alpha subunit